MLKSISVSLAALAATLSVALAQPARDDAPGGGTGAEPKAQAPAKTTGNAAGPEKASPTGEGAGQIKSNTEQTGDNSAGQKRPEDHEQADKDKSRAKGNYDGSLDKSNTKASDGASGGGATADGKASGKTGEDKSKGKASLGEVTPDQKAKAKSVFSRHRVTPSKVDISVSVGVAVPRHVHLYAVPEEIVVLVPMYRTYRYFIVDDKVCIVDPDTLEIVDIIVIA
ncbi:MAG: DUF1236 domain-containing protein [Hyphomicrobium sp.]|nr:DUF1236 domain-containing protein [Hyphomicrobium sp.]